LFLLSFGMALSLTVPARAAAPRQDDAKKEEQARGGGAQTSLIEVPPGALSHVRRATVAGVGSSGLISEIEPNDTFGTAQAVPSATRVRGTLHRTPFVAGSPDEDFYSFTAGAGDHVFAATMTGGSGGSTDTVLDILGLDGTTVLESDDEDGTVGGSASNIAGLVLPAAGTYFVRVRQFSVASLTGTIRPYDLYVRVVSGAPTPEAEPNDNGQTPNPLPANGYVSGVIQVAADNDTFSLSANAGDTIVAIMDVDPERDAPEWNGRMGIAAFNNFILVANGSGVGGAFDDANPSEALMMTVRNTGNYFIYVDEPAAGGAANFTYHLAVFVIPATPRTCTNYPGTGGPITDLASTDFTLNVPGADVIDYVKLNLAATNTPPNQAGDFDITLLAPDGNEVFMTDDLASPANAPAPQFNTTLEDEGAIPVGVFGIGSGAIFMPELQGRMEYFRGMQAQGTWTLRIRDDLTGGTGVVDSWSLDVCTRPRPACVVPGPVEIPVFATDFETGDGGFTHAGTQDEWERGLPTFAPLTTAHSGTNAWKTDLDNTYDASANMDLQSPPLNLTALTGRITLTWWQKFQMESANFDNYWVEVRNVGVPASAQRFFLWNGATMTRGLGSPIVTVNQSAGWAQMQADISSFAGSTVEVRFHVDTDTTVQFAGVAIDDVSVTACTVVSGEGIANLAITKTDGQATYFPGEQLTYTIVATNGGPDPVLGANVEDTLPAGLTGVTWTCTASGGSSCANATGSGNIDELVDLIPSGTATFVVVGTVALGTTGDLVNTATVTVPAGWTDPDTANNTATDTDTFVPSAATSYFTVTPCRLMDTRAGAAAPIGGPALSGGVDRTITVPPNCGIPATALAISLNITAVSPTADGNIRFYPAGTPFPTVSMLNFSAGQTRGNNGIASLGAGGMLTIRLNAGTSDCLIDVNGYFE
jgi:uncharacterized repeat protein (TIGR01451 family)